MTEYAVGSWVRTRVVMLGARSSDLPVEVVMRVDRVRADGALDLGVVDSPVCSCALPSDVEPWVPRVGERVTQSVVTGGSVAGTVTDEAPVTVGVDVCVRWAHGFGSRAAVSYLTPIVDASGRPVVERGVHYPGEEPLRIVANPPGSRTPGEFRGTVNVDAKWKATGTHCVRVGPDAGLGLRDDEPFGTLAVLAEVVPSYVPKVGDRVATKGRTGTVCEVSGDVARIEWERLAPGTRGERVEPEWHRSAWPFLTLLPPVAPLVWGPGPTPQEVSDAMVAAGLPPLPSLDAPEACRHRAHGRLEPGETRVHWWACGCAIEPEGEDHLGLVNGEPRGVLVWGHGTDGEGFTRAEAVTAWRDRLAYAQREGATFAEGFSDGARARHAARKAAKMDAQKGAGDFATEKRGTDNERPIAITRSPFRIHLG